MVRLSKKRHSDDNVKSVNLTAVFGGLASLFIIFLLYVIKIILHSRNKRRTAQAALEAAHDAAVAAERKFIQRKLSVEEDLLVLVSTFFLLFLICSRDD